MATNLKTRIPSPLPSHLQGKNTGWRVVVPPGIATHDCYAMLTKGDCLFPLLDDGDMIICSPSAELKVGAFAAFYLHGKEPAVKRLLAVPPKELLSARCDNFTPLWICQMINPPRQFHIPNDKVEAVHAVVHVIKKADIQRRRA